jgi:hypothetical protein
VLFRLSINGVRTSFSVKSNPAFIMLYLLPRARISARAFNKLTFYRAHHNATGRFITISPQGILVNREVEVWLGDPGNAYVMFDPEKSRAFQTGTILQGGCSMAQDQELYPLNFHHDTRHFSHSIFVPMIATLEIIYIIQNRPLILDSRFPKIFRNNRMPTAAQQLSIPME